MPFDVNQRTPLSRTMAPLASKYEDPVEVDLDQESLKHYGVQGMRWGVRKSSYSRAGKTFSRTVRKVKKATSNYIGKRNAKKVIEENKKKQSEEATKRRKKSPKDMDDNELKDYYGRTLAQRKLQAAVGNKVLDLEARGKAQRLLREMDGMSTADLKKSSDEISERARQLNELRPSYGKKPGRPYKMAGNILKGALNSDTFVEFAMNKTITNGLKKTKLSDTHKDLIKNTVKGVVKKDKDAVIDKTLTRIWETRVDKRGGF